MDWTTVTAAIALLLVTLITALSNGLKGVLEEWFRRIKRWSSGGSYRKSYALGLKAVAEFYGFIEHVSKLEFVDRALVFVGNNCGGLPMPTKKYTVRCFYGWCKDPNSKAMEFYNFPLHVDSYQATMLQEVVEDGFVLLTTSKMPEDCQLKKYYSYESVVQSFVGFIKINELDNELIYMSIANYTREFTPTEIGQLQLLVERVRALVGTGDE